MHEVGKENIKYQYHVSFLLYMHVTRKSCQSDNLEVGEFV